MRIFVAIFLLSYNAFAASETLFTDNFETDLNKWELSRKQDILIRQSGDPKHGKVMELIPNQDVFALMLGSQRWKAVRIQGEVRFPENVHNYLGVIYNFHDDGGRLDFGNIYIKGNGSYLQPNPHWDYNVGRTLYPEYEVTLSGSNAVKIGEWQPFKVEVIRGDCHFYFADMNTPQLTFTLPPLEPGGKFGLKPRSVGGEVWVDNIKVDSIDSFTYNGPPKPAITYNTDALLTEWEVLGPLQEHRDEVARDPNPKRDSWRSFEADARGAVITGLITDYRGPRAVAYFRTKVQSDTEGEKILHFSTVDNLALWVNNRFVSFIYDQDRAWFDFLKNPEHKGQRVPINLKRGENVIVVRSRGGVYASGGFYAALETP